jgi:hypothetical protein
VKAAALVVAALVMLARDHVTVRLSGYPVTVPLPALIVAAELATAVVLVWLIVRKARACPDPYYTRRTA